MDHHVRTTTEYLIDEAISTIHRWDWCPFRGYYAELRNEEWMKRRGGEGNIHEPGSSSDQNIARSIVHRTHDRLLLASGHKDGEEHRFFLKTSKTSEQDHSNPFDLRLVPFPSDFDCHFCFDQISSNSCSLESVIMAQMILSLVTYFSVARRWFFNVFFLSISAVIPTSKCWTFWTRSRRRKM